MTTLLFFLLLAAQPAESSVVSASGAVDAFHCDFEAASDLDVDGWPDGWSRRKGREFPRYLKIGIEAAEANHVLRIQLDGGGATVNSPPISISPLFSYQLAARLKTDGLRNDEALVSITFLDADRKPLGETYSSARQRGTSAWTELHIGPLTARDPAARLAIIGLHLRPGQTLGQPADLRGSASFDDVRFVRLPRMALLANSEHHVYTDPAQIEVRCELSGIPAAETLLALELLDVDGGVLARHEPQFDVEPGERRQTTSREGRFVKTTWKPPIAGPGLYRVRASIPGPSGELLARSLMLAVVQPQPIVAKGEFGWSLPDGERPLSFPALVGLLENAGVNWVKFPMWHDERDVQRAEKLARLVDRLGSQGIQFVGLLDQPPASARELFSQSPSQSLAAAAVFAEPKLWQPLLDPVMHRLSLSVRWWQLGSDHDTSFVGYRQLNARIKEIKQHVKRFGQDVRLGLAWQWLQEPPKDSDAAWDFLSYTTDAPFAVDYVPPLTSAELEQYLDTPAPAKRWLMLRPLPRGTFTSEARAADLVARMLVAKVKNASAVFVPEPIDREYGLFHEDGTVGELFLPWRTTSLLVAASQYIGSLEFPSGCRNFVFERGGETTLAVWHDTPVTESLYLGEQVRQVDLWGRERPLPLTTTNGRAQQTVEIGPLPTFLIGLNLPIARLRMSLAFDKYELASIFGREQTATFRFKNFFPQAVGGQLSLHTPDVWEVTPRRLSFKLAEREEHVEHVHILLRDDASSGPQSVRLDFDVTADRRYQFSLFRTMHVGLNDVFMDLATRLDPQGNLVVEQKLTNNTDEFVSFNCLLFAPDRRRFRKQIMNVGRGQMTENLLLPDGRELLGQTLWLRAEEIGGSRILNYRFTAVQ